MLQTEIGDRRRGHLGQHRAVAAAQRPQRRPARAAAARHDDATTRAAFTNIGAVNSNRPFVNGNREQTNNFTVDGVDVNETIDNRVAYQPSPDALAEISVETNNYAADVGNVGGRGHQQRHQVRHEPVPRATSSSSTATATSTRTRGRTTARARRSRSASSTSSAARSAARSSRTSCSSSATTRARGRTRRAPATASVAPAAWRTRRPLERHRADPRPADRPALPGQPDPARAASARSRSAILNDPRTTRCRTATCRAASRATTWARRSSTIRAHQGDAAARLERVGQRQALRPLLVRDLPGLSATRTPFPLVLSARNDQPFWNVGGQLEPHLRARRSSTRCCVGYSNTTVTARTYDWAGIGNANADVRHRRRPADRGPQRDQLGQRAHRRRARSRPTRTRSPRRYQINEKLTWLKGRHAMKFGGQLLHYDQQRFYAGNNGLLGFFTYNGAFTGFAFSDFLLDLVSGKGRGGGDPNDPWTHLQNRIGLFVQDDFKVTDEPDPEPRPALGLHVAARREGQPAVELRPRRRAQQIFAKDGSIEDRALYKPYYNGWEPRLGVAWSSRDRLGRPRRLRHLAVHGGHGRQPAAADEPAVLLRVGRELRHARPAPGTSATGFAELVPGTTPSGNVRAFDPNLRPQFTQQWNVFVEYQLTSSMSAQVGYVGHHADHLVAPVEGNQALPGVGDPSTWAPTDQRRPLYAAQPLITTIATTAARARQQATTRCRRASASACSTASSSWRRTRSARSAPTTAASTACSAARAPGRHERDRRRLLEEHLRPRGGVGAGVPRRAPQLHRLRPTTSCRSARAGRTVRTGSRVTDAILGGWSLGGIFQARSGLPDHRHRRPQPVAPGRARRRAAELRRRPGSRAISRSTHVAGHQRVRGGAARHLRQLPRRRRARARLLRTSTACSRSASASAARRTRSSASRRSTCSTTRASARRRATSRRRTPSALITSTISSPRVIELALKFYF